MEANGGVCGAFREFVLYAPGPREAKRGGDAVVFGGLRGLLIPPGLPDPGNGPCVRALRRAAAIDGPTGEGVLETAVDADTNLILSRDSRAVFSFTCSTKI